MSCILFSPVGKTDPITNYHDGSLIHICRKYRPEKVYLYLSQEMLTFHHLDNRYCKCLEWLQEKEGFSCEIHLIECPDLVEVQIFDTFYDEFEKEVLEIQRDNPEATILLNVSSGTPAMKSALQFLAATSENMYIPVQVNTPQKGANREKYDFEQYDLDTRWELNEDNIVPYEDRCIESETMFLNKRIKLEVVQKHIQAYDYQAAWRVAQTIEKLLPEETLAMLEGAAKRFELDCAGAEIAFRKADKKILPSISSDKRFVVEYLLWLQIKQQRGDLVDFLRGVTPVFVHILIIGLKEKCNINFYEYCYLNDEGIWRLSRAKLIEKNPELYKYLDKQWDDGVRTSLSSTILVKTFEKVCSNQVAVKNATVIRGVEEKARNTAAHEIVSVTEEWLQKRVGYSSKQIMKLLKDFTIQACSGLKSDIWNSYDTMNELIIEMLKTNKRGDTQ